MGTLTYLEIKAREAVRKIFAIGKGQLEPEHVLNEIVALLETQLQKASGSGLFIVPDNIRILVAKSDWQKFTPEMLATVSAGLLRHVKNREYLLGREVALSIEENASVKEGRPEFVVSRSAAKIALTLILKSAITGKEYIMPPGQAVKLGRAEDNAVIVPAENVSGAHASVEFTTRYEIYLSDSGSLNGTYFKGKKVEKTVCLKSGDKFQLARLQPVEFEVRIAAK